MWKHLPRGFASNQKCAKAIVSPCLFKRRNLDVDCSSRPKVLQGVDNQMRDAVVLIDVMEKFCNGNYWSEQCPGEVSRVFSAILADAVYHQKAIEIMKRR